MMTHTEGIRQILGAAKKTKRNEKKNIYPPEEIVRYYLGSVARTKR